MWSEWTSVSQNTLTVDTNERRRHGRPWSFSQDPSRRPSTGSYLVRKWPTVRRIPEGRRRLRRPPDHTEPRRRPGTSSTRPIGLPSDVSSHPVSGTGECRGLRRSDSSSTGVPTLPRSAGVSQGESRTDTGVQGKEVLESVRPGLEWGTDLKLGERKPFQDRRSFRCGFSLSALGPCVKVSVFRWRAPVHWRTPVHWRAPVHQGCPASQVVRKGPGPFPNRRLLVHETPESTCSRTRHSSRAPSRVGPGAE